MKKKLSFLKFARFLITGIFLNLWVSFTIAQEFDTDVPMGWAVVPGYADDYTSGVQTTTGGAGGEVVTATSASQLASYAKDNIPRIILVQGTMSGTTIDIGSNKTILGLGSNAKCSGAGLNVSAGKSNIIIRNLTISGSTDGIATRGSHHIWIDHCDVSNCGDGAIDITKESDRHTVSWTHLHNHDKTMLINSGTGQTADRKKLNTTLHHMFWDGTNQRNPRAAYGMIHVLNCYYNATGSYGIGLHSECRVRAEKNYFLNSPDAVHQMYTYDASSVNYGSCECIDNIFVNCSGDRDCDGKGFPVNDYYMYDFIMDPVSNVPSIVQSGAGPAAEFGVIGLMPIPGQGAVKVKNGTLSWKTGTQSPSSYKVYFGTTTNPPLVTSTTGTSHNVSLSANTIYYWRVDQVTSGGTINGKLWFFSTGTGIDTPTPVTGVSVSPTSASVGIGGTTQLSATVAPSNATNKNVSWSSSSPSNATVSATGLVTGVALGTATITVTTLDGGYMATCNVTISNIPVTGVTIAPTSVSVYRGATTTLTATVLPANASNKNVSWETSNSSIATVSSSGVVTGVTVGSATITVTTQDGSKTASCVVNVVEPPAISALIKLGFNENTGNTVANAGTASATFTKTAPPAWSTNVPVNGGASSVDFGTTTGNYYVESGTVISQLAGMTSFTVTGWVNCKNSTVGSGGNRIVSWINNGANGVDIVYLANGSIKVGINQWPDASTAVSNTGKITTNASATAANWKFFAVTYQASSSTIQFYFGDNSVPASLDKSLTYNRGNVGATIGKLAIGHFNAESSRTTRTDRMFKGLIDQVEVYGSSLSLQEIQAIQNIGGSTIIDVTGVSIAPSTANIGINATTQLIATVLPTNATNKVVSWSSSNTSVATVSPSGLVTGVSAGSATITVTTQDGNKTATAAITVVFVPVNVTGVTVSPTSKSIGIDETTQLTTTVAPSNATNKTVSWSTSNSSVATVNSSGLVTGVAAGSATITVTTQDGGYAATCLVTVIDQPLPTTVIIQENTTGFCSVDGTIDNNNAGFTGTGFANTDNASGKGITWSVNVPSAGTYSLLWRFANGGTTDRPGQLMVDGTTVMSTISMTGTGSWTTWKETSAVNLNLSAGTKRIRLQATTSGGLANIDYIKITGNGVSGVACSGLKNAIIPATAEGNDLNVTIFPIPASTSLTISFSSNQEDVNISLLSLSGTVVYSEKVNGISHTLDVSSLPKGLYIIKISGSKLNVIQQVLIN